MPESLTDHLLAPVANEDERVQRQQELLASARDIAAELVAVADGDASLTLLNVQSRESDTDGDDTPTERGETVLEELAERAGIHYMSYDTEIRAAEDTERAIVETAEEFDTICVGATRSGAISRAVFGSLPETVGTDADNAVVMARGSEDSAVSVREALLRRLEV